MRRSEALQGVRVIKFTSILSRVTAAHAHWAFENGLCWVLDVTFREDQSRLRRGHGATNMALIRHLALNVIRSMPGKTSIKAKRKLATWDTDYLANASGLNPR
jgi:hypothetical protein